VGDDDALTISFVSLTYITESERERERAPEHPSFTSKFLGQRKMGTVVASCFSQLT